MDNRDTLTWTDSTGMALRDRTRLWAMVQISQYRPLLLYQLVIGADY